MKIVLIGATGNVGSRILPELLSRGHQVTALMRHPDKLAARDGLTVAAGDAQKAEDVARIVAGHDAVVDAYNPGWGLADIHDQFIKGTTAIIEGVRRSEVKRLIVIGGAGSLESEPGKQLVDSPDFPKAAYGGASAARDALTMIRGNTDLDWTFVSPAVSMTPGQRTGKFRLGGDQPVRDVEGNSRISFEDLAAAVVDEVEKPQHVRKRFTLGY